MSIQVLDEALINKIAAGEVIERPASVVKELIENSLDAQATSVFVEIVEGGKSLIKVVDNGNGMSSRDLALSIERHATSKIKDVKDLFSIKTLGFRGEALASVAAVSHLKIVSRTNDFLHGNMIEVEGGHVKEKKEVGASVGTSIEVRNLFFNTPARKKYMESISGEGTKIADIVIRYSLVNPSVYFRLVHNGKVVVNSPVVRDKLGNILNVYGREVAKQLVPVFYEKEDVKVQGYVSKPSLTRGDKNHQSIYVNGRYVVNSMISSAVHDAYGTLLFSHRFPVVVLNIAMDYALVDVNVHPNKKEVRFSNERDLYDAVFEAVKDALADAVHIPSVKVDAQTRFVSATQGEKITASKTFSVSSGEQQVLEPVVEKVEDDTLPNLNVLGVIHNCYILAEDEEGFTVVDQHAAEERVNYEMFHKQYDYGYIKSQALVIPSHIELSPTDSEVLRANLDVIKKFGFDVADFGSNSFLVRATPVVMGRQMGKGAILDMIDELNANKVRKFEDIKDKIIARMACRKSIKQGDKIEKGYMTSLLIRLYKCSNPFTCPHGRPTMINISKSELERKFKRS